MVVAEVLRPKVVQVNLFLVELFVLLGAVVESYGQLYCVHGDESVDYYGHDHTGVSGVGGMAFKYQFRWIPKHV